MRVYLDNAATTPVDLEVFQAMKPYFLRQYGNASEPHSWGQEARAAIDQARDRIGKFLGAKAKEILFTGCATESINLAHKGLIEAIRYQPSGVSKKKPHIITSLIEHKAVLETCAHLERLGWAEVTYLPVDKYGLVSVEQAKKAIRPETILISIMYVNNEVGTIQPVSEIGRLIRQINTTNNRQQTTKIYFHTDVTQAIQYLDCDVNELGTDLLSFSGHKIHAPKGVGALYIREDVPLVRQQDGGGQEYRLRAGTENVPYIVAIGFATQQTKNDRQQRVEKIERLRNRLVDGVLKIPGVKLTGHPTRRAPHIASFIIEGVEGEAMLLTLADKGIAAASGSACTSGTLQASHVLLAMGVPPEQAHGSLRFSLSKHNTEEEINYVLKVLPDVIGRLRKMAPKLGARD